MTDKLFDENSPSIIALSNVMVTELKNRWDCPEDMSLDDWIEGLKNPKRFTTNEVLEEMETFLKRKRSEE